MFLIIVIKDGIYFFFIFKAGFVLINEFDDDKVDIV